MKRDKIDDKTGAVSDPSGEAKPDTATEQ